MVKLIIRFLFTNLRSVFAVITSIFSLLSLLQKIYKIIYFVSIKLLLFAEKLKKLISNNKKLTVFLALQGLLGYFRNNIIR